MKVAVIGSRTFKDLDLLSRVLDKLPDYIPNYSKIDLIISGGATGADKLAEQYSLTNKIPAKIFLPDYIRFGRGAPLKRNIQIVELADVIVAFWNGESTGTAHAIKEGLSRDKLVVVVDPDGNVIIRDH